MSDDARKDWIVHYEDEAGKRQKYYCQALTKGHAKHLFEQDVPKYERIRQIKHA